MNRSGCKWRMKFWNWAGNSSQSMCSLLHLPTELLCSGISPSLPSSLRGTQLWLERQQRLEE